jgi:hypothetical protein
VFKIHERIFDRTPVYVITNFVICFSNPVVPCSLIPAPSLEPWREHSQAQQTAQIAVQPQEGTQSFTLPFFK